MGMGIGIGIGMLVRGDCLVVRQPRPAFASYGTCHVRFSGRLTQDQTQHDRLPITPWEALQHHLYKLYYGIIM